MPPKRPLCDADSTSRPSTPASSASIFTPTTAPAPTPTSTTNTASKTKKTKTEKSKTAAMKTVTKKEPAGIVKQESGAVATKIENTKADGVAATKKAAGKVDSKDGKDRIKPVTGEKANALMVGYLEEQNRPYSATEVSANLHGQVTKTVADKLLKDLVNRNVIQGKGTNKNEKGSQWVFWATQDPADIATPEQLSALEVQINDLRTHIPSLKGDLKSLTTRLNTIVCSPTTSDLITKISELQKSKQEKTSKLQMLTGGKMETLSMEEVQAIEKEWKYWSGKADKRKRAYKEVEGMCVEQGLERDNLRERVGVEEGEF